MSCIVLRLCSVVAFLCLAGGTCQVRSHESPPVHSAADSSSSTHAPVPTLGGVQFWSDQLVLNDWRIQRHAVAGDYRLLDDRNFRRAKGTFEQCKAEFERLQETLELPSISGRVIIVLHGLGRTRRSMAGLASYLRARTDASVLNVSYASTRHDIGRHAESLASVVRHLPGANAIDFVAHSMGNLVIRHYLADLSKSETDNTWVDRVRRVVMLCPPNRGAVMATRFRNLNAFQVLTGASGQQIASWDKLTEQLATPSCEFGIIAGGTGNSGGYNPLIRGDDDLVLAVDETKLAGARDFVLVPDWHTTIMDPTLARQYVVRFLEHGYFRSQAERMPIEQPED